jgi:hypothetical protein
MINELLEFDRKINDKWVPRGCMGRSMINEFLVFLWENK